MLVFPSELTGKVVLLRKRIHQTYVTYDAKVAQPRRAFDLAMADPEKMLECRGYLVGNRFCGADLMVAAVLSLLAMPPEHCFPWQTIPDTWTQTFSDEYRHHPICECALPRPFRGSDDQLSLNCACRPRISPLEKRLSVAVDPLSGRACIGHTSPASSRKAAG